jgi:hypothetical protein
MTDQAAGDNGPYSADDEFAVKLKGYRKQINAQIGASDVDIGDHPNITINGDKSARWTSCSPRADRSPRRRRMRGHCRCGPMFVSTR